MSKKKNNKMDKIAQSANSSRSTRGKIFEKNLETILSEMLEKKKIKSFETQPKIFDGEFNPDFIVKTIDKRYKTLTGEICQFINDIIVGLYNLKKTYPEYKELKCRVDSIIMTLVDFKDKVKKNEELLRAENIIHERALSF